MACVAVHDLTVLCFLLVQKGCNAIHLAALGGHINAIRYLASKRSPLLHSTDNNEYTALHWAALNGHVEIVHCLINEFKLDPTARDKVCTYIHRCSLCDL